MKKIITKPPLSEIAKAEDVDYTWLRKCVSFKHSCFSAYRMRALVLKKYKSSIIEV